jgi:hypothetical protein
MKDVEEKVGGVRDVCCGVPVDIEESQVAAFVFVSALAGQAEAFIADEVPQQRYRV